MIEDKVVFQCEENLTLASVAGFVQKSSQYRSTVYLIINGRRANAKSMLGVMSLGIENGSEIEISADGDDAEIAVKELSAYLNDPKV